MVGKDIDVDHIMDDFCKTPMGVFSAKSYNASSLRSWVSSSWKPLLGYVLVLHVMVRDWIAFVFHSKVDYSRIQIQCWNWGKDDLLSRHWFVDFDPMR